MFKRLGNVAKAAKRKMGRSEITIALVYPENLSLKHFVQNARIKGFNSYIVMPVEMPLYPERNWQLPTRIFAAAEAVVFLVDSRADTEVKRMRELLWERLIWDPKTRRLPLAVGMIDSELPGALTGAEIVEYSSLVRLTDRFWNVIEMGERDFSGIVRWLTEIVPVHGRVKWETKGELIENDQVEVLELIRAKEELAASETAAS